MDNQVSSTLKVLVVFVFMALLSGCQDANVRTASGPSSVNFRGRVMGGQQPVTGATVTLYAVGQTGDGSAATSLMTSTVTTDSNGNFVLTGQYSCPTATPTFPGQVFLVASQGNPGLGSGGSNPQLELMAALGICSQLNSTTTVVINELTTVASVAALAPYMSSWSGIGSGTTDAEALGAAMNLVTQYVNTTTGSVPGPNLLPGYTAPTATLVTLANLLSACVNSSGGVAGDGSSCGQLFTYATAGSAPADTVGALLNILNNPTVDTSQLFALVPSTPPFGGGLTSAPSSFAIPVVYAASGKVELAETGYEVSESGGSVTLNVTRAEGSSGAVGVSYSTANGTATAGTDYTSTSGTLSWANGDASVKTITVPVTDARITGDGTRTFTVSLSNVSGGATLGTATTATVTVFDDDSATAYYVSPTGSDSNSGLSSSAPFLTLTKAQTMMRSGSTKTALLMSGTFYLTSALSFTSSDNGETWAAAPGATPVISGGTAVTGWTNAGNGLWKAPLTLSSYNGAALVDLEIGGQRQLPAMIGYDPFRPYMTGWHETNNALTPSGSTLNVYAADLSASAQTVGNVIQIVDETSRYTDHFSTITSASTSANTITFQGTYYSAPQTASWRVLGDYRDISVPGQFGFNAATNTVYVMPVSDCSFSSTSVAVAAQLPTLFSINTVANLTITGLTFSDTISNRAGFTDYSGFYNSPPAGTIQATGLTNSTITGNRFANVGNGISLTQSTGNNITWNTFDQLGGTGIFLKTAVNNTLIQYNTFTNMGRVNIGSYGISVQDSENVKVDSNYIAGTGRTGINLYVSSSYPTYPTSNLTISNNTVVSSNLQTNDTAGIYAYAGENSTNINLNSTISGNRVENPGAIYRNYGSAWQWAWGQARGIYMDDKVGGMTINGNVTETQQDGMLLCHGCSGNSASYNVAILQPAAQYTNYNGTTTTQATGTMSLNGTTSVSLMPSFFPYGVGTSVIVVQLSGSSSSSTPPAFNVLADGLVIGSATASTNGTISQYVFTANLAPHTTHTIGIQLTNGNNTGSSTQTLSNLYLFVNNTPINLAAGTEYGMQVLSDQSSGGPNVTDYSYTFNIAYRSYGSGSDISLYFQADSTTDADPGVLDYNLVSPALSLGANNGYEPTNPDLHGKVADPQFLDVTHGDYTLNSGSPAFGLGYVATGVSLAQIASYPTTTRGACSAF